MKLVDQWNALELKRSQLEKEKHDFEVVSYVDQCLSDWRKLPEESRGNFEAYALAVNNERLNKIIATMREIQTDFEVYKANVLSSIDRVKSKSELVKSTVSYLDASEYNFGALQKIKEYEVTEDNVPEALDAIEELCDCILKDFANPESTKVSLEATV